MTVKTQQQVSALIQAIQCQGDAVQRIVEKAENAENMKRRYTNLKEKLEADKKYKKTLQDLKIDIEIMKRIVDNAKIYTPTGRLSKEYR